MQLQVTAETVAEDILAVGRIESVATILQVVSRTTGLRFAAVARVTDESWTACAVLDQLDFGLAPGETLPLESTLCNEVRQTREPVVINHASKDPVFCAHPTPARYHFESYISVPIFMRDGRFFGTLCALDPEPARLDGEHTVATLQLFAQLLAAELESAEQLRQSERALGDARETARLREQFIAVLGHDLRQPLQVIGSACQLLRSQTIDQGGMRALQHVERSCGRMQEMIGNLLDLARARIGGGIPVAVRPEASVTDLVREVIEEVAAAHREPGIEVALEPTGPVWCDRARLAQLLGNLLANAITHGTPDRSVRVAARVRAGMFELEVMNGGAIAAEDLPQLFQPFSRKKNGTPRPGLGLGLYIANEIAKAHNGSLRCSSSAEHGICFAFHMPAIAGGTLSQ